MLTVRTSENTVITSFRLISERQDFSSVRTVRTPFARVREFKLPYSSKLIFPETEGFDRDSGGQDSRKFPIFDREIARC